MTTKLKSGVVFGMLALGCLAVGTAHGTQAATKSRATPAAMARHITSLGYPYAAATCQGRDRRNHGTYAAFLCFATGTVDNMARSWKVWAKPLPRRMVCGSAFSLKTCHRLTAPVYGGEDKCCSLSSDTLAALARPAHHGGRWPGRGLDIRCAPTGAPYTYWCHNLNLGTWNVAWTKASYGWLPKVSRRS